MSMRATTASRRRWGGPRDGECAPSCSGASRPRTSRTAECAGPRELLFAPSGSGRSEPKAGGLSSGRATQRFGRASRSRADRSRSLGCSTPHRASGEGCDWDCCPTQPTFSAGTRLDTVWRSRHSLTMQVAHTSMYRHPTNGASLSLESSSEKVDEIEEGQLSGGGDTFPIRRGTPRFCPPENYADTFGYQWNTFSDTQLDSRRGWDQRSRRRLFQETRWPDDLRGQRILEAGSGAGRFTEVLAATGAEIFSFDYSAAVDANRRTNGHNPNVAFAQADIYHPPFAPGSFDKVLCLGVLQHCPHPRRAFESLVGMLKPGGEIVVDVYRLSFKTFLWGKHYLRPVTRLLPPRAQHAFVKAHLGWAYPVTGAVHRALGLRAGRYASWVLAVADFRGLPDVDDALARELAELDTLDMLAPRYDRPKTIATVRGWFRAAGLTDVEVGPGYNGVEGRGRRPS